MKAAMKLWKVGPGGVVMQIDTNDADTPAMVWDSIRRRNSSTYDCATSEGMIDDVVELTAQQQTWLEQFQPQVDQAFEIARAGDPRFG